MFDRGNQGVSSEARTKGMRHTMQKSWYMVVAALALMLLATGPLAALPPSTATFALNSAGSGANLAGVYTSPYTGTINGGSTINVICDDFADDSYVPESWTAYVTSLSSLTSGTADTYLKWLNTAGSSITVDGQTLNQATAYAVAAVLSVEILGSITGSAAQEDYSFALWGLFDPTGVPGDPSDAGAFGQLANYGLTTDENNAKAYLNSAVTYVTSGAHTAEVAVDVKAVTIYSFDPNPLTGGGPPSCSGNPCPTAPPQEFITVSMVEPPSPALLGLDLLSVAGLIFFVRRRMKLTSL